MSPFLSRVKSGNSLDDSTTPGQVTKRLESPVLSKKTTLENQSKYSHLFKLTNIHVWDSHAVWETVLYEYDYFSLWLWLIPFWPAISPMRGKRMPSVSWHENALKSRLFHVSNVQSSLISAWSIRQTKLTLPLSTSRGSSDVKAHTMR